MTFNTTKGLFVASVLDRRDNNGVLRRRFVYAKRKCDFLDKLKQLQKTEPTQQISRQSEVTIFAYLCEWLETAVKTRVRDGTYRLYDGYVRNKILRDATFSGIQLRRIAPSDVRTLYSRLAQRGDSPSLQRKIHVLLKSALKQAVKDGILTRNVLDAVDPPRVAKSEMQCLDERQTADLLKALVGNPLDALYVLAISCGLRLGELLGLQWTDLNPREGLLSVRRTFDEKTLVAREPKSERSRRTIELPLIARQALRAHQKRGLAGRQSSPSWVFCD